MMILVLKKGHTLSAIFKLHFTKDDDQVWDCLTAMQAVGFVAMEKTNRQWIKRTLNECGYEGVQCNRRQRHCCC